MSTQSMTYEEAGVKYADLDPFKREAQGIARLTTKHLTRFGVVSNEESRGESCYLIRNGDHYLAHVEEGLGTKNLVADAVDELLGTCSYAAISQCTAAMVLNDLITSGAMPVSLAMHVAVGDSVWFKNARRTAELIRGWANACILARCSWGGGETPTLKGIVVDGTILLSGSAIGRTRNLKLIDAARIQPGDVIIFFESSGIHANGLTLARLIATRKDSLWRKILHMLWPSKFPLAELPDGYLTRLRDGTTYGEALLAPTHIYVRMVEACLERGVDIRYAINVTGHGWRKLMRAARDLVYVIDTLPTSRPVFEFIQKHGPVSDEEAYGNLNMGVGFAIIVPKEHVSAVLQTATEEQLPYRVFEAGRVEEGPRKVVIIPKQLEYVAESLQVR